MAVTADDLTVLGTASQAYSVEHPRPDWAEQDPRRWERALPTAIAEALMRAGRAAGDVAAVGIAGQLDGCAPTDAAGEALGPCLIWMDRRAHDSMPALPSDFGARTGLVADPSHMAAKARWLARHRPGAARYHQPVSLLVARLTGEHVFDRGLASTTMVYDLERADYDDELLACFELERAQLPRIDAAAAVAGRITAAGATRSGLPAGTPVCVGTGDDFATPLGAGIEAPGPVACVLGTAEVVGALHGVPAIDAQALVETHAYPGRQFFVENPGWLAGGSMAWLARLFDADFGALDRAAASAAAGSAGLTFVPALTGAMAPEWVPGARGVLHGLTPTHDREHVARAVMEGCAFAARDVIDRLRALSVRTDSLVMMGGGARSRTWVQMHADVARVPAAIAARVDTCPVGAAALAAASVGADLGPLVATLRRRGPALDPDPVAGAALEDAYARYRSLFAHLTPMWRG